MPLGLLLVGVGGGNHRGILEDTSHKLNADGQVVLEAARHAYGRQPTQIANATQRVGKIQGFIV